MTLIYSTFPSKDEAFFVARILLENQLIACANVLDNMHSLYRWEGQVQEASEVVLVAKTSTAKAAQAIELIKAKHPYELPAIVTLPITGGYQPFLDWISSETV